MLLFKWWGAERPIESWNKFIPTLNAILGDRGFVLTSLPVVYTVRGCSACDKLIAEWNTQGIRYEERRADLDQRVMDKARELGDAVPIVVYPNGRVERRFGGRTGCYIG